MLNENSFERKYEDVLQNIEFGIVQVYRANPKMTDWEALNAVEALMRAYKAENRGREVRPPRLNPLTDEVYHAARAMCEMRLGRGELEDENGNPVNVPMKPITLDEIIACLKRIRKSIKLWTKERGRRGYLDYVQNFLP